MRGPAIHSTDRASFGRASVVGIIALVALALPVRAEEPTAPVTPPPVVAPTPETPVATPPGTAPTPPAPKKWARLFDVRLASGYPETIGVCGDSHPMEQLELTLCLGGTRDIVTSSQAAKWAWNTVQTRDATTGAGETSFHGLGLALRELYAFPASGAGLIVGPELLYSYEHVWWQRADFGWELSVEAGASWGFTHTRQLTRVEVSVNPLARVSFGVAF